jgi:hypothetical protein
MKKTSNTNITQCKVPGYFTIFALTINAFYCPHPRPILFRFLLMNRTVVGQLSQKLMIFLIQEGDRPKIIIRLLMS